MARTARCNIIDETVPGIYHVFSRTVRRAFLFGTDAVTGKDYSHRLELLRCAVRTLARLFAIDLLGFGFMQNHFHEILRNRPDLVKRMSNYQVALRWCLLNELGMKLDLSTPERTPKQRAKLRRTVAAMMADPERLKHARACLSSISVYEQRIKGTVARLANQEDRVTGHFWCGRFESNPILTPEELLTAMVYVDLNPVRAGLAETPEESRWTSAYERIHGLCARLQATSEIKDEFTPSQLQTIAGEVHDSEVRTLLDDWLSPIDERRDGLPLTQLDSLETVLDENCELWQALPEFSGPSAVFSEADLPQEIPQVSELPARASNKGCLCLSVRDYLRILDWSGRQLREDKKGSIPEELPPLLERLGIGDPANWLKGLRLFGQKLSRTFSAPINQAAEAARAVIETAAGTQCFPEALL